MEQNSRVRMDRKDMRGARNKDSTRHLQRKSKALSLIRQGYCHQDVCSWHCERNSRPCDTRLDILVEQGANHSLQLITVMYLLYCTCVGCMLGKSLTVRD